ncbi:MAG: aspartate aminotransferase family protein [Anaerolinea sp.]|nr:aspartate aminotransferase family protein [Anaerolinea sp.]MCC6974279.1 aspartate aminotransferase family protein [Anaerolineae bacterium]
MTDQPTSPTPLTSMSLEDAHTSGVYPKRALTIVRGQGAYLWDSEGRRYIDCVGGQGAANLGHAHPAVVAAIQNQAATLISCPEIFYNDTRAALLEKLTTAAGMPRAFLCNSGTEAVEAALKFAKLATGRKHIVAAKRGFHGRTMGALAATWEPKYREPFEPGVPNYTHVPYNDLSALEAEISDQTAALILEVVQGEGGVRPGDGEYLRAAQALCRERGAMFITDEVQTGFGRTGKLFAHQHYGLEPDLMPVAKSMAGGLPMGACLIGSRVGTLEPMTHGSTFGGNPLACAAALAALEVMDTEDLPGRAAALGGWMLERLADLPSRFPEKVREVRGLGLLLGIELRNKVAPVLRGLQERGVLALPAGVTVLRLLPPLVISKDDLELVAQAVEAVLTQSV